MAEDRQLEGQQVKSRLQRLVGQWAKGQVTLKEMLGLTDDELWAIAQAPGLLMSVIMKRSTPSLSR